MKDDRLRQPFKPDYGLALGQATYCFAICEWNVVWSCEKILPGSLNKIVSEKMTAGQIGKLFADRVRNMRKSRERDELAALAAKFLTLVELATQSCTANRAPAPAAKHA